ncbi:hypothetical protein [Photobacterium sanguinicancri]|uniref:hypothetical protein n=1 Tax=Photobacterium sanguinicancri TaxID=875932 RepID=UPI0026E141B8|nr:hypothetical protein [Photobacterium sanguinicancri]MDO6496845.1 hypothetical protein [Photobacterium sanguinicancri]
MGNSLPSRASTNPIEGVNRCECGDIRTIHRSRGKRAKFFYSICDTCGTDQRTGKPVQSVFEVFYPSIEALLDSEQQTQSEKPSIIEEAPQASTEPSGQVESSEDEKPNRPEPTSITNRIDLGNEAEKQTEDEPKEARSGWVAVLCGIVLGGLTGGAIVKLS